MVFLQGRGFPDAEWLKYYVSKLNLKVVPTNALDLLDWVRQNTDIRYYIVVDPVSILGDIDHDRSCTINIAATLAGIVGNAIPILPSNIPFLEARGYTLLPDSYCDSLGHEGRKLRVPGAFDLRNQWTSAHADAPWDNRQQAYKWALDALLPLTDQHSITLNYGHESGYKPGVDEQFDPWINDYPIAQRQFIFYFNANPNPQGAEKTNYDRKFYRRLLREVGPMTMVRGWHWDEMSNLGLISKMRCYNFGSKEQANSSVHAALSAQFTEPMQQRRVKPDDVALDDNKIYLTFTVTDGDQPGVVYRGWSSNAGVTGRENLWDDPARGQIPINWTMNGLMYAFDRGIMRYYFDNASPKDYFVANAPVGYSWLSYENFGPLLNKYDAFADFYIKKTGLPVVFYLAGYGSFPPISDSTVAIHVRNLTNAEAFLEGYSGFFYQGVYWPEDRPLVPYLRTTLGVGMGGYSQEPEKEKESPGDVARKIADIGKLIPWRPLFIHVTWVNWFTKPSDMKECLNRLNESNPGQYELVGMPEILALAQKAKMTGKYPLEFYPHRGGEGGLEGPYLWQQKSTTTNAREERRHMWRGTRGDGFFTYKFNITPARQAAFSVDLSGANFRVDVSGDNLTWTANLIQGSSSGSVTKTANLTPYLNARGSVYLRFSGDVKVYHVKVDYGP
jgi:hypothetical protein